MLFLIFSNADVQFAIKELTWKTYITRKALPTTRCVKLIEQKKFAKAALNENIEAFVVHISFLELRMTIYPARKAQLALLLAKKVTVLVEYSDFADVFLEELKNVLPKRTKINEHAIELQEGKQPLYEPIYSLRPVELKTFKTYMRPTWLTTSSVPLNHQRMPQFCLYISTIVAFVCVSITKGSITLQSKIGIRCYWLASS